jgi:hypothetical protein
LIYVLHPHHPQLAPGITEAFRALNGWCTVKLINTMHMHTRRACHMADTWLTLRKASRDTSYCAGTNSGQRSQSEEGYPLRRQLRGVHEARTSASIQCAYLTASVGDAQPLSSVKALILMKSTSKGLSAVPSYANSAYGFSLDHNEYRLMTLLCVQPPTYQSTSPHPNPHTPPHILIGRHS